MRRYEDGGLAALDEESDDVMDPEADEYDTPGGAITQSGGLSALDFPGAREAFALMAKSSADARLALQRAREQIQSRKYSRAHALLAASAALGAPTRAGSTAESFGAMAGALRGPLAEREKFEQDQTKDLLSIDTSLAGLDEKNAQAQLQLAMLSAKLANESARAPNDLVRGPDAPDGSKTWVYATRAKARGQEGYTQPPTGQFVLAQQPLPDGTIAPVIVNSRTGAVQPSGPAYKPISKLSGAAALAAKGKLATTRILRDQLKQVRDKWTPLKKSWSAGKLQGWVPSEKGEAFDKAVAAMRGTIRQLTRVPGEGSMSDWEGRIDQAKLPDRGDYEEVTEQTFGQLEELIKGYEETTKEMLGEEAGKQAGKTLKFDKNGKRIQ